MLYREQYEAFCSLDYWKSIARKNNIRSSDMLYDRAGNRKYLTARERGRFIAAAHRQTAAVETFCLTLAYTGARISEVLALRSGSIDLPAGIIVIECLKKA